MGQIEISSLMCFLGVSWTICLAASLPASVLTAPLRTQHPLICASVPVALLPQSLSFPMVSYGGQFFYKTYLESFRWDGSLSFPTFLVAEMSLKLLKLILSHPCGSYSFPEGINLPLGTHTPENTALYIAGPQCMFIEWAKVLGSAFFILELLGGLSYKFKIECKSFFSGLSWFKFRLCKDIIFSLYVSFVALRQPRNCCFNP